MPSGEITNPRKVVFLVSNSHFSGLTNKPLLAIFEGPLEVVYGDPPRFRSLCILGCHQGNKHRRHLGILSGYHSQIFDR